jgi:hypothetical protein
VAARTRTRRPLVSPRVALVATVLATFVVYGALAHAAEVPRFFMDELFYMRAGVSVAAGDGLEFRGESWGYGPLYPLLLAPLVSLAPDQETTYALAELLNATAFALAAVPVFLLARRLLPPWPSVGVAAVASLIPSSMYVSVVMTESVAYLVACVTVYAVLLALERPTVVRQLATIALTLVATALRPQLVVLYAGYLVGLAILALVPSSQRTALRTAPRALWPTALSLVAGIAWLARPLVRGDSPSESLGSYRILAEWYDPLDVAKWLVFNFGDIVLYLAVIPVVVAPIVIVRCWSRARAGSDRDAAFLALFVGMNATGIALIGAFSSTEIGLGIVHDRYLFYLVPLWLVVLAVWLHDGLPRPRIPLAIGALVAMALVAVLPYGTIAREHSFDQFEAVATEIWGKVGTVTGEVPDVSARTAGIVFALGLVVLVAFLPRRRAWVLPACVVTVLLANSVLSWRGAFVDASVFGLGPAGTRTWVDDVLGPDDRAAVLYVARDCNPGPEDTSELETEFFNRTVARAVTVGGTGRGNRPSLGVHSDGTLWFEDGAPFVARFVVTQPGVELVGRELGRGMRTGLVLWETSATEPVRAATARTDVGLRRSPCPA